MVYSKKLREAAGLIKGAMVWSDTEEGFEYWKKIKDRLLEIAEEEESKTKKEMVIDGKTYVLKE